MTNEKYAEIKKLKAGLKEKLKKEKKTFKWFWEDKIMEPEQLVYSSFMGSINGNGGDVRGNVESIIRRYLAK